MLTIAERWYRLLFHVDREESSTLCLIDSVQVTPLGNQPIRQSVSSAPSWTIPENCRWAQDRTGSFGGELKNKAATLN